MLIYSDTTKRKRAEEAIRAARDAAEKAFRELQTAQASLVHAQRMTAGIAHEIKNPLNFVNNFTGLSVELLDELMEAARAVGALDPGKRTEIVETIRMLTGNLEKIVERGRRADGIVRSMLQHSRGSSEERQPTDLNALAEEALNLAFLRTLLAAHHKTKTAADVAERKRLNHLGLKRRKGPPIRSRGLDKTEPQRRASRPLEKWKGFD